MLKIVLCLALVYVCNAKVLRRSTCTFKGKEYSVGTFYDGCNRCQCHEDKGISCVGCPLTNRATSCIFNNQEYPVGSFKDGDNNCKCHENGQVGCVGTGTHAEKDCTYEGENHKSNTIWITSTGMCECQDGLVGCRGKRHGGSDQDYPDEEQGCEHDGKTLMHGQMFRDGCAVCSCTSGKVTCDKSDCRRDLESTLIDALKRRLRELE